MPSSDRNSGLLQYAKRPTMWLSHFLWKPGAMARFLTAHVTGSAGMSPLPMIGSRISASTPLSYFSLLSFRMCFIWGAR